MNEDQIEDLLRRVRPAGPRPDLRARIMAARPAKPAWPWAAAAAALLAMVVALQWSAGELRGAIRPAASAGAAEDADLAIMREAFELSDEEVRAMTVMREFDRIMASEATGGQAAR